MLPHRPDSEEILAFMRQRRSIRRYETRPVAPAVIERLVEAACWGPSAHNRQPWRFVALTNEVDRRSLATRMAARLARDLRVDGASEGRVAREVTRSVERLMGAPALVLVCLTMRDMDVYSDSRRQSFEHQMAVQSVAMASQNLLLMAHTEGLGTCWMCAPLFCPDEVRDVLGLPPDYEPQGIITLGYPAETPEKTREPLDSRLTIR